KPEVPIVRLERRGTGGAHVEDGTTRAAPVHAGAEGGAGLLHHPDERLGKEVGVDVDAEGPGHQRGFYYPPRGGGSLGPCAPPGRASATPPWPGGPGGPCPRARASPSGPSSTWRSGTSSARWPARSSPPRRA